MTPANATIPVNSPSENPSGFMPLTQAAKWIPGRRVHVATLWRWCRKGYNGIFLQYVRVGRSIMVSQDALCHFFAELAAADSSQIARPHQNPTIRKRRQRPENRQAAIDAANVILRRAKIIV